MIRSSVLAVWILGLLALPASAAPPILESGVRIRDGDHNLVVDGQAAPDVVDWNADGKRDLVVGQGADGKVRVYLNTGTASSPIFDGYSYVRAGSVDLQVDSWLGQGASPRVVDWNEDGKTDLIIGDANGNIRIFVNVGTSSNPAFNFATYLRVGDSIFDCGTAATPEVVDWNNDGKKDVLCGDQSGRITLLINTGSNSAPAFSAEVFVQDGGNALDVGTLEDEDYSNPVVVDWNADGKKDLLSGRDDGYVVCYENQGTDANPSFSGRDLVLADGSNINVTLNSRVEVCDWNNDGMPDLVVGDAYGNLTLYLASVWGPGSAFDQTQHFRVHSDLGESWQVCLHNYTTAETSYHGPISMPGTIAAGLPCGPWQGVFLYSFTTGRWEEALWAYRADW